MNLNGRNHNNSLSRSDDQGSSPKPTHKKEKCNDSVSSSLFCRLQELACPVIFMARLSPHVSIVADQHGHLWFKADMIRCMYCQPAHWRGVSREIWVPCRNIEPCAACRPIFRWVNHRLKKKWRVHPSYGNSTFRSWSHTALSFFSSIPWLISSTHRKGTYIEERWKSKRERIYLGKLLEGHHVHSCCHTFFTPTLSTLWKLL